MLDIKDLACSRGGHVLFSGLSFSASAGEALWIEGPNGSGKTSLLRILCGLSPADEGEVRWQGQTIDALGDDYRKRLLFLGHHNALKEELSIEENLRFSVRLSGHQDSDETMQHALESVGLISRRHLLVRYLSQGQRRRAALARLWLLRGHPLWILDEPFAALDQESIERLTARIASHLEHSGIAVLTTHQSVPLPSARTRRLQLAP